MIVKPEILNKQLLLKRIEDIIETKEFHNGWYSLALKDFLKNTYNFNYCILLDSHEEAINYVLAFLKTKFPIGGKIIVPSFFAPINLIKANGFEPVFCDVDNNFCFDLEMLDSRISPATVAIMPINCYGNYNFPSNFNRYRDLYVFNNSIHGFNLCLENEGTYSGNFGDFEVFDFSGDKIFGSFNLGLIVTRNSDFISCSQDNINTISAASLLTQLEMLEDIQDWYFQNFQQYKSLLPTWVRLHQPNLYFSNFSYILCSVHRSIKYELISYLAKHGFLGIQEPFLNHKLYPEYSHIRLPNSEEIVESTFLLPTGLTVESKNIESICDVINSFVL